MYEYEVINTPLSASAEPPSRNRKPLVVLAPFVSGARLSPLLKLLREYSHDYRLLVLHDDRLSRAGTFKLKMHSSSSKSQQSDPPASLQGIISCCYTDLAVELMWARDIIFIGFSFGAHIAEGLTEITREFGKNASCILLDWVPPSVLKSKSSSALLNEIKTLVQDLLSFYSNLGMGGDFHYAIKNESAKQYFENEKTSLDEKIEILKNYLSISSNLGEKSTDAEGVTRHVKDILLRNILAVLKNNNEKPVCASSHIIKIYAEKTIQCYGGEAVLGLKPDSYHQLDYIGHNEFLSHPPLARIIIDCLREAIARQRQERDIPSILAELAKLRAENRRLKCEHHILTGAAKDGLTMFSGMSHDGDSEEGGNSSRVQQTPNNIPGIVRRPLMNNR